ELFPRVGFIVTNLGTSSRAVVPAASVAGTGRQLVADQLAAAVGEDRRAVDQACALLLVAAGRGASDTAAVCRHAAEDRGAAVAGGIRRARRGANFDDDAGAKGKVPAEPFGKRASPGVACPSDAKPIPSRRLWKHRGPKPAKILQSETIRSIRQNWIGESKRKFRFIRESSSAFWRRQNPPAPLER